MAHSQRMGNRGDNVSSQEQAYLEQANQVTDKSRDATRRYDSHDELTDRQTNSYAYISDHLEHLGKRTYIKTKYMGGRTSPIDATSQLHTAHKHFFHRMVALVEESKAVGIDTMDELVRERRDTSCYKGLTTF